MVEKDAGLRELIVDYLGERLLELPDPYTVGWTLPRTEEIPGGLEDSVDDIIKKGKAIHPLCRAIEDLSRRASDLRDVNIAICTYDALLSGMLVEHDLGNMLNCFRSDIGFMLQRPHERQDKERIGHLLDSLVRIRIFCLTMAYLASQGEKRFLFDMPMPQIEYIRDLHADYNIEPSLSSASITNADYVALWQFAKNTCGQKTIITADTYSDLGDQDTRLTRLAVRDNGWGIYGLDKKPITPDALPGIFGRYSTREGGGLGLQIVKRISELRKGFFGVLTKSEGKSALWYNTITGVVTSPGPCPSNFEHGTEFNFYIRRV